MGSLDSFTYLEFWICYFFSYQYFSFFSNISCDFFNWGKNFWDQLEICFLFQLLKTEKNIGEKIRIFGTQDSWNYLMKRSNNNETLLTFVKRNPGKKIVSLPIFVKSMMHDFCSCHVKWQEMKEGRCSFVLNWLYRIYITVFPFFSLPIVYFFKCNANNLSFKLSKNTRERQKSQNNYLSSKKIPINRYGKRPNRYRVSKKELPSL